MKVSSKVLFWCAPWVLFLGSSSASAFLRSSPDVCGVPASFRRVGTLVRRDDDSSDPSMKLAYDISPLYARTDRDDYTASDNDGKISEFGVERRDPLWQERSNHLILLVDDDCDLRQAVGTFLDQQGYQVTACASAEMALEWLNANSANHQTSLIVSDIRMPGGMDGLEFLNQIRQNPTRVSIPVVLLTAKGQTQDRIAGYNAGADAYLTKPFEPSELVSILDSLLARQKRFTDPSVTMEDLKKEISDIKSLLQKGGAGEGVNGFVEASNVFMAPDERQILELLCEGLSNKDIAQKTFLSSRRVEQLLTNLYRKTGVSNRTELVRWAIRTGTIRL
eukprot:scaffold1830_cov148-Amphora_coffeaeformis.AAC.4